MRQRAEITCFRLIVMALMAMAAVSCGPKADAVFKYQDLMPVCDERLVFIEVEKCTRDIENNAGLGQYVYAIPIYGGACIVSRDEIAKFMIIRDFTSINPYSNCLIPDTHWSLYDIEDSIIIRFLDDSQCLIGPEASGGKGCGRI